MGSASTGLNAEGHESHCALLIIDMVSNWRFADAEPLRAAALEIAPAIARLKQRCKAAGFAVVYANDNQGRWRSDWRQLMQVALEAGGDGARIASMLAPDDDDYFVLKPMHSAFFGTPLQLLLQHLHARHLILTGVSSDQCVLFTAAAARMEGLDVSIPRDTVASQTTARTQASILHFDQVLNVPTPPERALRLPPAPH